MDAPAFLHHSVLLHEAVSALIGEDLDCVDGAFVDATFGRGGHSREILSRLSSTSRLDIFDRDPVAVRVASELAKGDARIHVHQGAFSQIRDLVEGSIAGVLFDLGVSSPQIDDPERGFSFRFDGPLDMRMDNSQGRTVADWLESAELNEIAMVIKTYGEDRFATKIAKNIVYYRDKQGAIKSTAQLAKIVADAVRTREAGQHPATRTFQAFRIFINAELEEINQALQAALNVLQKDGRLVVISFHSLEDRIVKQFIAKHSRVVYDRSHPFAEHEVLSLRALGRFKPTEHEIALNPRARSAIMRVAQKVI